jgi:deoxyribodipyrimidine photolyase-related protein
MDRFYRWVRQATGVLMEGGKPLGGRYSFDGENREVWRGIPPAAREPEFPLDPVKEEVLALVERLFPDHPGELRPGHLPATLQEAQATWRWAREACLPHFGPFEDAMSVQSTTLFHTRISSLLNLHRLLPRELMADVLEMELPLASKEGFIRQLLGWREFVRHVHGATDGFRTLPEGGIRRGRPLPAAWWGTPSGLHCLDHVVADVWREGYSHHITRLMVLANLATLLEVDPRELTDWFWVAYTDAYDWVVEPNVLGMGTFATGDLMTTKPYVSGTPYIRKMSDYCDGCALDPDRTCPVSELYWAFLERHRDRLHGNRRMALPLASASRRSEGRRAADARVAREVQRALAAGERVTAARVRAARDAS